MAKIEQSLEVNAPAQTAYEQLTKFEQYSRFMDSVKEIRQLDNTHLHLRSSAGDQDMEWDAEITEQIPDRLTIAGERNPEPVHEAGEFRRSERSYGHFYRVITLPSRTDPDRASAELREGVMTITVPLPDKGVQARKLEIHAPES